MLPLGICIGTAVPRLIGEREREIVSYEGGIEGGRAAAGVMRVSIFVRLV